LCIGLALRDASRGYTGLSSDLDRRGHGVGGVESGCASSLFIFIGIPLLETYLILLLFSLFSFSFFFMFLFFFQHFYFGGVIKPRNPLQKCAPEIRSCNKDKRPSPPHDTESYGQTVSHITTLNTGIWRQNACAHNHHLE
jgi:hypothetical protein